MITFVTILLVNIFHKKLILVFTLVMYSFTDSQIYEFVSTHPLIH